MKALLIATALVLATPALALDPVMPPGFDEDDCLACGFDTQNDEPYVDPAFQGLNQANLTSPASLKWARHDHGVHSNRR